LRTTIAEGHALIRALHGRTSGLCQPTYVLDIPGGHGKSPIGPCYLSADGAMIEDFNGRRHVYAAAVSVAANNTEVSNS
jgi:lysine 2,3-aminomutase